MEDFKAWYFKQPLVTRTYISAVLVATLLAKFNILNLYHLLFSYEKIIYHFQIWRLFTDYLVVGSFSFHLIFILFIIYFAFSKTEELFSGPNFPDFIYLLFYILTFINILSFIFDQAVLHRGLSFALIYIWCKRKPFETVTFYFGIRVQSAYFPWVLMGFHFLIGDDITMDLFGLAAGHSYIVLKDFLPITHNKRFLETPKFFVRLVDRFITPFTQFYQLRQRIRPQQQQGFGFFGGQGVRLG